MHQRPKIVNIVGRCDHYNDCKVQPKQILLIFDTLVYCEKYIEFLSGAAEQRPVFDARPAHLSYGMNVMAGKLKFQPSRYALIQQHAHLTPISV